MKGIMKSKKLIGLAVILGLVISVFPLSTAMAAGTLTGVSDTISPLTVTSDASHTIAFTTIADIPVGGKIEITFASGFSLTSVVDTDVAETLTAGTATFTVSGQKLIGTTASAIATAGAQSIVLNGTNKINNPAAAGTYAVSIVTKNAVNAVLDSGYCLVTIGGGTAASVTVKTYISMTISDTNSDGVQFGAVDPNSNNNPDVAQSTTDSTVPSVTLTAGSENNATITVEGKLNAAWSGTWATADTSYGLDFYDDSETSYTTDYATLKSGVAASGTAKLWHFIDIPAGAAAGTQQNTIYFQAQ